jgi:cation diffusion facilitator CzcD-associated flavoprotein CzcO
MTSICDVAVVGAGPHGLAAAAHLLDAGVETRVFGKPMSFWREHMPSAMLLRSSLRASSIASPKRSLSLLQFARERHRELAEPLPLSDFLAYGSWFQRLAVPDADTRLVTSVELRDATFTVTLDDGEPVSARRVLVAAGIAPFAHCPPELSTLPRRLVSHSADHTDLTPFSGRQVVVVGGGQSALESAALLHEVGADVEVIARADHILWLEPPPGELSPFRRLVHDLQYPPTDVGPRGVNWVVAAPDLFRLLPERLQPEVARRAIAPAGAAWLTERLTDVTITAGRRISAAAAVNGDLRLRLNDGTERRVDHALIATGYRVDIGRYPFLAPEVLRALRLDRGYPLLSHGFESSVRGLHFLGAPAALSFGPVMRFVCGTSYAARSVTRYILGLRRLPLSFSW